MGAKSRRLPGGGGLTLEWREGAQEGQGEPVWAAGGAWPPGWALPTCHHHRGAGAPALPLLHDGLAEVGAGVLRPQAPHGDGQAVRGPREEDAALEPLVHGGGARAVVVRHLARLGQMALPQVDPEQGPVHVDGAGDVGGAPLGGDCVEGGLPHLCREDPPVTAGLAAGGPLCRGRWRGEGPPTPTWPHRRGPLWEPEAAPGASTGSGGGGCSGF